MGIIILFVLVVLLMSTIPTYGYSRSWGYRPASGVGLLLFVLLLLLFLGTIPWGFARRPVYVVQPRPVIINPPERVVPAGVPSP